MDRLHCLAILPGLIALLAFCLALYGVGYCQFVAFSAIGIDGGDVTVYSGIWNYQTYNLENLGGVIYQDYTIMKTCSTYPPGTYTDAMWEIAKAFSIMGLILGGLTTFFSIFAGFFSPFSVYKFKLYGASYLICSLFTGLSLFLLGSNACNDNNFVTQFGQDQYSTSSSTEASDLTFQETCSMGPGAQTTIAATVLWIMAGVVSMKTQPPPRRPITTQTHDITYTKTTDDNGLVMISEDVVKGQPLPTGGQQNHVVEQAV